MYFPYVRGRQYELLSLRELVANNLISKKIVPVVEPVKLSPTLVNMMAEFIKANHPISIIRNPSVGTFLSDYQKVKQDSKEATYRDKFEEILKSIYENTINNKFNEIFLNQLIEEIIMKIPKIPQGYKFVILCLNQKQIDLTEKKLNDYPTIHIDLSRLFALFKISIILEIFKFILYEGQIIFFSSKIYDLTNIIMSFLFLISPFEYQYQVISILPKNQYFYIESDLPYIFGVNEKYSQNFFVDNKLDLKQKMVCIVDLDEKTFETIPKKYNTKEYPDIPKHFKEIIDNNIQQYYKYLINSAKKNLENVNNSNKDNIKPNEIIEYKPKEQNEQYQLIFHKFMTTILSEYPKYLYKTKPIKENKEKENDINNMIDITSYLNSVNLSEHI